MIVEGEVVARRAAEIPPAKKVTPSTVRRRRSSARRLFRGPKQREQVAFLLLSFANVPRMEIDLSFLRRPGVIRLAWWLGLAALTVAGCASVGWTEEPGAPVPLNYAQNLEADDQFLEGLASRRTGMTVPEPVVTPALQSQLRAIATMLQSGELSVAGALRASERWGRATYHRDVDTWLLDCARGRDMTFPSVLVNRGAVVISFASVHHRLPNEASEKCSTLVVSANGSEMVQMVGLR